MRGDRGRALEQARTLLADDGMMRDAIDADLPHERFAPGRLASLRQRFALAQGNIDSGLGETALAQAQEIYMQLAELRTEVELRYQEWQAAQVAAHPRVHHRRLQRRGHGAVLRAPGDTWPDTRQPRAAARHGQRRPGPNVADQSGLRVPELITASWVSFGLDLVAS